MVITNQEILAKGLISFKVYRQMQKKMESLLGNDGAFVDASYFCPHMPAKYRGLHGEIAGLKTDCNCRKPAPGMIFRAVKDMNIDIANSWMIGDHDCDVEAGRATGRCTLRLDKTMEGFMKLLKRFYPLFKCLSKYKSLTEIFRDKKKPQVYILSANEIWGKFLIVDFSQNRGACKVK
ncbi:hypothetical protein AGMMS49921_03540 [Endomicrobiia bacterium]|nr:hypothetical protein AGMMS49921_03540 [Endomicrobiia bacterium]